MIGIFKFLLNYILVHRVQLFKFIVVGFTAFFSYFFSFHLFYGVMNLEYWAAASLAYPISVAVHFLLHRAITFSASDQAVKNNIWRYVFMLMVNYGVMLSVMWFVVNMVGASPYIGIIASTATTAFISFFMMKYFVFGSRQTAFTH